MGLQAHPTLTSPCISITISMLRRLNQDLRHLCLWPTMTPSVPWIAAPRDICGMERQFPQTLFFPRWL
jgi:hypothetical protein